FLSVSFLYSYDISIALPSLHKSRRLHFFFPLILSFFVCRPRPRRAWWLPLWQGAVIVDTSAGTARDSGRGHILRLYVTLCLLQESPL
ncbi:hypothetical protein BCR44DRAFT_1444402, partial [Catenaria anguillulae PL171]